MRFTPEQRPLGIQIFGADEEELLRCLEVVEQAGPDFIDINWGCPVRKVAGRGAGSGILQDVPKMLRITASIVKKAHLPVSVKTRLAYSADSMMVTDFAEALQDCGIAALSIHGRTKNQMYSGSADWRPIAEVKSNPRIHIPIFGNGDITTAAQAVESKRCYGVDGILIGRAAIGNPWIFEQCQRLFHGEQEREVTVAERVEVCRRHLQMAIEFKGERTAIFEMRKHYGNYFRGLYNFKPFRLALVATPTAEATFEVLNRIQEHYQEVQ
jgi:nifR3 family TIM-barrel protein